MTGRATCSRSTTTASRRRRTSRDTWRRISSTSYGFSEWVGPEPHGLGKHNTGTVKDVFTADETVELLQRLDGDESDRAVAYGLLVPRTRTTTRCSESSG